MGKSPLRFLHQRSHIENIIDNGSTLKTNQLQEINHCFCNWSSFILMTIFFEVIFGHEKWIKKSRVLKWIATWNIAKDSQILSLCRLHGFNKTSKSHLRKSKGIKMYKYVWQNTSKINTILTICVFSRSALLSIFCRIACSENTLIWSSHDGFLPVNSNKASPARRYNRHWSRQTAPRLR